MFKYYFFIIALVFVSCKTITDTKLENIKTTIEAITNTHAPDKRTAVVNFNVKRTKDGYLISGESDKSEAIAQLKSELKDCSADIKYELSQLPQASLGEFTQAVITNSVANLRSMPKHSAELSTQALLGTPVKVLKQEDDWYYVQTPDKYLAWVDHGGLTLMTPKALKEWQNNEQVIYTKIYGFSKQSPSKNADVVSDLVAGNLLRLDTETATHFKVHYPDGREAYIPKTDAVLYSAWKNQLNSEPENLVETSKHLLGLPYLWGGTSVKGVDCSGFIKTIYFLNGVVLPRDASQQVLIGEFVDDTKDFNKLQIGDLLFFGTPQTAENNERITHVGMWIGNNEFIHASERVRISSVDETKLNYDEFNLNRYLRTKRLEKMPEDAEIINLKTNDLTTLLNF